MLGRCILNNNFGSDVICSGPASKYLYSFQFVDEPSMSFVNSTQSHIPFAIFRKIVNKYSYVRLCFEASTKAVHPNRLELLLSLKPSTIVTWSTQSSEVTDMIIKINVTDLQASVRTPHLPEVRANLRGLEHCNGGFHSAWHCVLVHTSDTC